MNKQEFFEQLEKSLKDLPKKEQEKIIEYYQEMYDDQQEEGKKEKEILQGFGSINQIKRKIEMEQEGRKKNPFQVAIQIICFPILVLFYIVGIILDLSLWLVGISLFITAVLFGLSFFPYLISAFFHLFSNPLYVLYQIGGCIAIVGIGVLLLVASYYIMLGAKQFFHLVMDGWNKARKEVLS